MPRFDVIKTFPDSKSALLDLRDTLERTHLHRKLVLSLREVLQQRLNMVPEPLRQLLGSPILAALVAAPGQVRNHEGSTGPTRI